MPVPPVFAIGAALLLVVIGVSVAAPSATIVLQGEKEYIGGDSGIKGHLRLDGGRDGLGNEFITSAEWCREQSKCQSEDIIVTAWTDSNSVWDTALCNYRYKVSLAGADGKFAEEKSLSSEWYSPEHRKVYKNPLGSEVDYQLREHIFRIIGPVKGAVKVELEAKVHDTWAKRWKLPFSGDCGSVVLASDDALLLNGHGNIKLKAGQSDIFQEGQTATFVVTTGHGHWKASVFNGYGLPVCAHIRSGGFLNSLTLFAARIVGGDGDAGYRIGNVGVDEIDYLTSVGVDPNDPRLGPPVLPPARPPPKPLPPSTCKGDSIWSGERNGAELKFEIPAGAFRADGHNRWTVRLENTLTQYAQEAFIVIDQKAKAPEPPKVKEEVKILTPTKKKVTLSLEARGNGLTGAPVTEFVVYAWYGQEDELPPAPTSPNWVANGVRVPVASSAQVSGATVYRATYAVDVEAISDLQWRYHSVDGAGRNSASQLNEEDAEVLTKEGQIENVNTDARHETDLDGRKETPMGPVASPRTDPGIVYVVLAIVAVLAFIAWFWVPAPPPLKIGAIALLGAGVLVWALPKLGGA